MNPRGRALVVCRDGRPRRRTLDAALAKKLETKGFTVQSDSEGKYYEISHTHAKAGEMSSQAQASFDMGWAFWKSGRRKKAMEIWEANVKHFPTHRDSWYNLGLAYARDDEFRRPIKCLKKAVDIDPSDGQVWWYLGFVYRLSGNEGNSRQAYARAQALGWQQRPM